MLFESTLRTSQDVTAATLALKNLYGRMLSNSVKGGIRLSYSKNPLGVRGVPNGSIGGFPQGRPPGEYSCDVSVGQNVARRKPVPALPLAEASRNVNP